MGNETKIYIALEEGAGLFHAPVACHPLPSGSYEILPDSVFDHEDGWQLFEFGPGDIIQVRRELLGDDKTPYLVAHRLIRSGSDVNDFKRLLFDILEEKPDPFSVVMKHSKVAVRRLLTEGYQARLLYSGVREWISLHQQVLEEAL